MEYLKVKPHTTKKEARENSSLGLMYQCPECKVGHALTHLSSNKVKCNLCEKEYKKP